LKDLHGQAILDFYKGENHSLLLHNSYGDPEEMPVEVFFRDDLDFTVIEHLALVECEGRILDVGAGAGAHALVLQERERDVVALENSPGCLEVLKKSGITQVVASDFFAHQQKYDTLLLLMNGLGLAGTVTRVPAFLAHCKSLLNPSGQILVDSSDIAYLYEEDVRMPSGYYGEIKYRYEYKEKLGDWFDWLYLDEKTLKELAKQQGLSCEIMTKDENDQYLARLVLA
jgi:cyclopropane fatty-acyl-phospholipid synthase-like methyltransferase